MSPAVDSKLPISVCTLCLDEASNLPRCLDQVAAFAEWIVLDTGSNDNSTAIARRLGARVEHAPWQGFAATRRHHFSLATQPWILWIDADEVITAALVSELRQHFVNGAFSATNGAFSATNGAFSATEQARDPLSPAPMDALRRANAAATAGWRVNRLMHFDDRWIRHGDWYPDWVTRLFRADSWCMSERAVHESVEINGKVERLREPVPHYSYVSREDRQRRVQRYARLWAQQQLNSRRSASPFTQLSHATWRFLRGFVLRGGFLDGATGWWIARSNAAEVYAKYGELRTLRNGARVSGA